jgi:hypothetical protein
MSYRLAHALDQLRSQIDAHSPNRSKLSDGWIGDAGHKTRDSDHNPWLHAPGSREGIVTAIDITHDPGHGVYAGEIAEQIIASQDPRLKYLIWNSRIVAGGDGPKPWRWRKYGGINHHNKHVHISVEDRDGLFDQTQPWALDLSDLQQVELPKTIDRPLLKRGAKGEAVAVLQRLLVAEQYALEVDGKFGPATDRAVRHFQKSQGAKVDGVVGPYTWELLES